MLTEPTITFSRWVRWRDRADLMKASSDLMKASPCMGIYVWAHFKGARSPDSRPYPDLPEELIYIGEANDLNVRPLTGSHHRLKHYCDQFPNDRNFSHLYVSVCEAGAFRRSDPGCHALRAFTKYVEARLGWEYTRKFGRRPLLDYKKDKDELYVPGLRRAIGGQRHRRGRTR